MLAAPTPSDNNTITLWTLLHGMVLLAPADTKPFPDNTRSRSLHNDSRRPHLPRSRAVINPGCMKVPGDIRHQAGCFAKQIGRRFDGLLIHLNAWLPCFATVQGNSQAHITAHSGPLLIGQVSVVKAIPWSADRSRARSRL